MKTKILSLMIAASAVFLSQETWASASLAQIECYSKVAPFIIIKGGVPGDYQELSLTFTKGGKPDQIVNLYSYLVYDQSTRKSSTVENVTFNVEQDLSIKLWAMTAYLKGGQGFLQLYAVPDTMVSSKNGTSDVWKFEAKVNYKILDPAGSPVISRLNCTMKKDNN